MIQSKRFLFRIGSIYRADPHRRVTERYVGLCLWMGLSAALVAVSAWGAEERTAAPGGIVSGWPSGEREYKQPELSGLENTPEGGTLPGGTLPGGTLPGGTLPGGTLPNVTVPGGTLPGGTFPNATVPGGTLSGGTVAGGTVPSANLPGEDP